MSHGDQPWQATAELVRMDIHSRNGSHSTFALRGAKFRSRRYATCSTASVLAAVAPSSSPEPQAWARPLEVGKEMARDRGIRASLRYRGDRQALSAQTPAGFTHRVMHCSAKHVSSELTAASSYRPARGDEVPTGRYPAGREVVGR